MNGRRRWCYAAAIVALAGCGGGDGGGSSTVPVVPGPAPTPTPTPTPTPAPTPTPTYETAFDSARDRTYGMLGAELRTTLDRTNGRYVAAEVELLERSALLSVVFDAASRRATIARAGRQVEVFERSSLQADTAIQLGWTDDRRFFSLFQPGPTIGALPAPLTYVVVATLRTETLTGNNAVVLERQMIGGTPTLVEDLPGSGSATYEVRGSVSGITVGAGSIGGVQTDAQLSADFGAGTLRGSIPIRVGPDGTTLTIDVDARRLVNSHLLTGSIVTLDGGVGTLTGGFFGPRGRDVAIAFVLRRGDQQIIGTVLGLRR